ncbi:MAG TPA: purine phosphoribosyltransferase family protein [Thermoplasmatales archaeon]|nr:hypoxanthine/guanine phosphoribosyltransferase [Candidatus Thermoplasmatota archaeon]MDD5778035.1 hypoxanthine/guanine phosphoribosyltransferase [Candidatus Thermoplasmatota archaeon]HDS59589.1 purine phosphoribosyltransferase family protein [Thermoplasmatales archaeon]
MKHLEKSLREAPVVRKGDYHYVVHPLTDGIPHIAPHLLEETAAAMADILPPCDILVTMEAMGIPLAAALSLHTGIPFTIIRKREYGLPGEVSVQQKTGYSSAHLFINGLHRGQRVVIVDDVVSTGGTLVAVVQALQAMGVVIQKIIIAVNKGDLAAIEKKIGMPVHALVDIEVNDHVTIV